MTITIQTTADFTPPGKRRFALAYVGTRHVRIQWYVSGRVYRSLPATAANIALSHEWARA